MKIVLITDDTEIWDAYTLLELSHERIEIVVNFNIGCIREFYDCEIEAFENIEKIRGVECDYVFIISKFERAILELLQKIWAEGYFLGKSEICKRILLEEENMAFLEKKILRFADRSKLDFSITEIGKYTYGTPMVFSDCKESKLLIGKFCSFANDVSILLGIDHRSDWNTTYPFNVFLPEYRTIEGHPHSKGDVVIGNDVWIAAGATILSGVTIGDGCIIGANAVVSRSVPPYSIVVGNPGRIVRKRFSDQMVDKLLEMKWWDWQEKDIYRAVPYLQSGDFDGLYQYYLKLCAEVGK